MNPAAQMIEDMVARIPGLQHAYDNSWDDELGVLPHLAFSSITPETVASFLRDDTEPPDWRAVLVFLEEQIARDVPAINKVIVTSFLDDLPYPGQPGHAIVDHLGPVLSGRFHAIRPRG